MEYYYIADRLNKVEHLLQELRSGKITWQDFDIENKKISAEISSFKKKVGEEYNGILSL